MSEPLALLPLAIAARDGAIDGVPARRLVAAGLSLLQRTPPLVQALAGRRSAILLPTSPGFLVALAASEGRGTVLINPLSAPAEIAYQLADAGVGAVFTSSRLAARLPPGTPRVLLDDVPGRARWEAPGATRDIDLTSHRGLTIEGEEDVAGSEEEATVVYTSAMSGYALGAIATHRNLLANAQATIQAAALTRDDQSLALLPFAHLFGLVVPAIAPLLAGGQVHCMERFHPLVAIERLERDPISVLVGVPAVFAALVEVLERRETMLSAPHLRLAICGGAPLAPALQERWRTVTGIELRQGYGLTEAGPVCLFNRVDRPNRVGSLGSPFPGVAVEIHDRATGALLPDGAEGEICVAGHNVSPGYVGRRTTGLQRDGRWLRTGDIGVRDPDGTFAFTGFGKAMFTRSGFNIYPAEIERVVGEMPGVKEARVVALPDPVREHDIALEVAGAVTSDEVKAWCEERLAVYKQPSTIDVRS